MSQPNLLFIMADQLVQALLGAYGHPVVQTPHLDQLARTGIRFDNAYTPYPLCGPARVAIATGKYASRLGVYDNATLFHSDELTLAHYLTLAGYDCVASGKLHYIGSDQLHGFSRRFITDIYPEDFSWLQHRDPTLAFDPAVRGRHAAQYIAPAVRLEWGSHLAYDEETCFHAMQYLRAKGLDKRRKSASQEPYQPFYMFVSFHHPHDPFRPPQDYWDRYADQPIDVPAYPPDLDATFSVLDRWLNHWHAVDQFDVKDPASLRVIRRAYYALVSYIDDKVGQLLTTLRENNLAEDTVIIFTSDHGDMLGEKGMVQKRNFYEWSAKVPLLLSLPDGTGAGRMIQPPVSLLDIVPTLLDLAEFKATLPHDGHSLLPLLADQAAAGWDVFAESHMEGVYGTCFMLRRDHYKYIYIVHPDGIDVQLFDLAADPGEWHNLARQPAYAPLEAEFRTRLLHQFDPAAIEREIQASIQQRQLLKRWTEMVGIDWAYTPEFKPGKQRTLDQYLR